MHPVNGREVRTWLHATGEGNWTKLFKQGIEKEKQREEKGRTGPGRFLWEGQMS